MGTKYHPLSIFVALTIFLLAFPATAQIFVSPADNKSPGESAGFLYALPKSTLKIDVIIQKTERIKGPYAEFAEKILGVSDYIRQDESRQRIKDVIISVESAPDPAAWFFVEFDERASKDTRSLVFDLLPNGIVLGADDAPLQKIQGQNKFEKIIVNSPDERSFSYYAERNLYQRVDTIVRKITIDTTVIRRNILQSAWVDRSPEQKARAAADMIHKIRESRLQLITGFQEVNYGQSIVFMDQKLQQLEEEYLSLFIGKEVKSLITHTLYYAPEPGSANKATIAGFSETLGVVSETTKANPLTIEVQAVAGPGFNSSERPKGRLNNSMYYRIPALTNVSVWFENKMLAQEKLYIGQLGTIAVAPLGKTRLQFDAQTGMVTTLKRE